MKVASKGWWNWILAGVMLMIIVGLFKLTSALRSRARPPKIDALDRFKDGPQDNLSPRLPNDASNFFFPGSLNLTRWETLNKCYVDPQIYSDHLPSNAYCVVSSKYKLIYYLVPKSGSSTNREVMTASLAGRETTTKECDKLAEEEDYRVIGFVRDPSKRIYSSYEEAIARKLNDVESIPKHFNRFVEGLPNYKAYEKLFSQPHLLTARFEQFLDDWDGKELFDNHLSLQSPLLAYPSGLTRQFIWLGEVGNLDADWKEVSSLLGFPSPTVIHGRSFPRRMNISLVTPHAKRRMCHLLALDYCCLNFPFPPECVVEGEETLGCEWKTFPEHAGKTLIVPVGGIQ